MAVKSKYFDPKTYYYKVYGVDEYGVTSPASNSLSVEVN